MKLSSLLKAFAAIVPRHKPRRGRNKRLPPVPRTSSPASFVKSPPTEQTDTGEDHAQSQRTSEEHRPSAALALPTVAAPRPPRVVPPPPPQKAVPLPPTPNPTIHLLPPISPSRPLSSIPPSRSPSPHYIEQEPVPYHLRQEEHRGPGIEESTASCSSETAVPSSAEGGPDVTPERPRLIGANLPSSPMREVEPSEPRLASATAEQPENATEIDTDATTNPDTSRYGEDQPGSHTPLVDSPALTLPASFISPETTEEGPDFEPAGSMYPSVAPMMPPLIGEDRDALEEYLADADDYQDRTMFLATLPHDGASDSAPLSLAKDEEERLNGQAKMGILLDHHFLSSDSLSYIKRKRSKQPLLQSRTHLSPISENPLCLSSDGSVANDEDDENKVLVFTFGKRTAARLQTVDEALDEFKAFLHQHPNVQRLRLTFEADICFPADFIAHAMAKVQKSFTHVELRLESTAAHSQAIWTWPLGSQLQSLRLKGIARGARLPLTQLQDSSSPSKLCLFWRFFLNCAH
ncbi:hypothetical protein K525DRAFT_274103 [Schizophyllum commune Loenen D]|nr:hypothetical protein K525DRAFT_274103 [Schizophyllum commune Loenen D]